MELKNADYCLIINHPCTNEEYLNIIEALIELYGEEKIKFENRDVARDIIVETKKEKICVSLFNHCHTFSYFNKKMNKNKDYRYLIRKPKIVNKLYCGEFFKTTIYYFEDVPEDALCDLPDVKVFDDTPVMITDESFLFRDEKSYKTEDVVYFYYSLKNEEEE